MRSVFIIIYASLFIIFITGCKKKSSAPKTTNIYVAGTINGKAAYWKNGVATILSDLSSSAYIITANGNDIYIAGSILAANGTYNAVYWKNGVVTYLGPGQGYGIAVQGSNIYVTGTVITVDGKNNQAAFWENGKLTILGAGEAYEIFLSGSDVYIAGKGIDDNNRILAAYWKNGVQVNFGYGLATAVTMNGTDLYVAGYTSDTISTACYWKNGNIVLIEDNADIYDIKVYGSDVYLAGDVGFNHAAYWKNNVLTQLNDGYSAFSLVLSGNDLYIAGYLPNEVGSVSPPGALLWKNNNAVNLAKYNGGLTVAQSLIAVSN